MDTAARLLQVLALLETQPWWRGDELAERLDVTPRTVRRDLARLRDLGYPIDAVTGPHGGYRLGAGGRLPPLVLDDEEAVVIALTLRASAGEGASGLESAALAALTKLDRVMPPRLRERVGALRAVTVQLRPRSDLPPVDADALVTLALACNRPERLRFAYRDAAGRDSDRFVEPYRLVFTDRRWYLVAFDRDRDDWRSFRVDRMTGLSPTGVPFQHRATPDAAAMVARGVSVAAYDTWAVVRVHADPEWARQLVPPTVGVAEASDDASTTFRIGGDPDWIARYLAGLDAPFDIIEPDAVRAELRKLARRLLRDHAAPVTRSDAPPRSPTSAGSS
jgi:predicted DNA-binding transcriptional regulator YafY